MKGFTRKLISVLTAFAMTVSMIAVNPQNTGAEETESTGTSEYRAEYVEGEALVIFDNSGISTYSSMSKLDKSLGSDITIGDTYMFGSEAATLSAYNNEDNEDSEAFIVASVSSDTLTTEQLVDELNSQSYVKIAEPNYIYKASDEESLVSSKATYEDVQWGLDETEVEKAYEELGTTGTDYVVAVIDTGIDYTNEDLADNLWVNPYPSVLKGTYGFDFTGTVEDSSPYDDNGHGSHVSGIIAGSGKNISGVTRQAQIMALKFLDADGYGDEEDAIAAYYYIYQALNLGINVVAVNNSWGGGESSEILESIVNKVGEKGAVTVFAAGNDGVNLDGETYTDVCVMDSPYVITVAASNEDGELASFSNYNSDNVDLAAPGTNILSTVSYNCFNPSIYTEDQINSLCSSFNNYDDDNALNNELVPDTSVTESVSADYTVDIDETGFGNTGKSLKISADAEEGDQIAIAVPYTLDATTTTPEMSLMVRTDTPAATEYEEFFGYQYLVESEMYFADVPADKMNNSNLDEIENYIIDGIAISGTENYWNHVELSCLSGKSSSSQERYVVIIIECYYDGVYDIYLDDFAISAENKLIDEEYGKYDFYNGTSMAAPFVTGAVALLSSKYSESELSEKVVERINEVKTSVKTNDALTDKCVSGGVLNLGDDKASIPYINSAVLKNGVLTIDGANFADNSTVSVTGSDGTVKDLEISSVDSTVIKINGMSDYNFSKVTLTIGSNGKTAKRTVYLADGNDYTSEGELSDVFTVDYSRIVTDGKDVYIYDDSMGEFYKYSLSGDDDDYYYDDDYWWYDDYEIDDDSDYLAYLTEPSIYKLFPNKDTYSNTYLEMASDMVYANGAIYTILSLSSYTYGDILYSTEYSLGKYDIDSDTWSIASEMPSTVGNIKKYNLTHYGQTLAVYNGYLYLIGGYDGQSATTDVIRYNISSGTWQTAASLPEARVGGKCLQTGNKLIYTLGSAVNESECPATLIFNGTSWKESGASLKPVASDSEYSADISLCKEGILYTGISCEGLGDTFIYNVSTDKYTSTGYVFSSKFNSKNIIGTTVGDTFYGFASDDSYEEMYVYTVPVNSGLVKVTASDYKYGYISGANEEVIPGTKVTLKAKAYSGSYFKQGTLKVNGTAVSGSSKTIYVTANQKASATFMPYVTKITLNKTSTTMYYGVKNTLSLKATKVSPSKADSSIKWSSSNTKYATVSSSGKVTIKKAGIGHTVTITAKATDGSKVTAKCKIKILQPVKKLKLSCSKTTVKAGSSVKVKATYSPKKAISKTLTWKSSNKKYATVNSSGKVKTKKAGKGHTVTITATTKYGKKVSAKIKIKIQ